MSDQPRKPAGPGAPIRRAAPVLLVVILALAGALRVAYLREIERAPDFTSPTADAAYHNFWARGLVTGNWSPPLGENDPRIPERAFARPPGYPYFLAAVHALAGPDPAKPRYVQIAIGLGTVALAFLLANSLFGTVAAAVTGALAAATWGLIYYEGELQEPVLAAFLLLVTAHALLACARRPSPARAATAGIILGLSALVRPNTLVLAPIAAVWILWAGRGAARGTSARPIVLAAICLAGVALAVAPAALRNTLVAKDPVLIAANGGITFYAGNNSASDGVSSRLPILPEIGVSGAWSWFRFPEIVAGLGKKLGRELDYSEASAEFDRMAWRYIGSHPGQVLRLVARKALLFWGPVEVSNNKVDELDRAASPTLRRLPGFPAALSLALLGIVLLAVRARRGTLDAGARAGALLVLLMVAAYFLSYLPFLVAGRFRVPIVPLLLVLAGFAVAETARFARRRDLRAVGLCLAVLAAASTLAHARFVPYEPDAAWWRTDRGAAYQRRSQLPQAIEEYRQAIAVRPDYFDAHLALGGALGESGKFDEGVHHFEQAIRLAPQRADVWFKLALLYVDAKRYPEAILTTRQGLQLTPNDALAQYNLGYACQLAGRYEEAVAAYRQAVRLRPDYIEAYTNMGSALADRGRFAEAEQALRSAVAIDGRFPLARLGLGNVLAAQGKHREALAEYQAALAVQPGLFSARVNAANMMLAMGLTDDAIREYKAVLDAAPDHIPARRNLANALMNAGRIDEALGALREGLQFTPDDPQLAGHIQALEERRRTGS